MRGPEARRPLRCNPGREVRRGDTHNASRSTSRARESLARVPSCRLKCRAPPSEPGAEGVERGGCSHELTGTQWVLSPCMGEMEMATILVSSQQGPMMSCRGRARGFPLVSEQDSTLPTPYPDA
ncbi:hypothetical protein BKA56DRAFT_347195 [Ilyonectria sp. MPI-CAGE-AT-0026]|nr:hypothetical protein BKA56DRAFT_347195 [Ilyonectria sp. MPI-CAGE-AT-0026]